MKEIKQAKEEYKCVFCATITYFTDKGTAYCIDCYCKLRDSAHTHEIKSNTPITPIDPLGGVLRPYTFPGSTVIC